MIHIYIFRWSITLHSFSWTDWWTCWVCWKVFGCDFLPFQIFRFFAAYQHAFINVSWWEKNATENHAKMCLICEPLRESVVDWEMFWVCMGWGPFLACMFYVFILFVPVAVWTGGALVCKNKQTTCYSKCYLYKCNHITAYTMCKYSYKNVRYDSYQPVYGSY